METKDAISLAAVAVAATGVFIAWLKYLHDTRVRKEDSEPASAKPFVDIIHTFILASRSPDMHTLRLEVSNRGEKPIAVKEVYWSTKAFTIAWPLTFSCASLPEPSALTQHKIETAELLRLDVDIKNIFEPLVGSERLPLLDTIVAVATMEVRVILTTGEVIHLPTPWTFRTFLAGQFVRPSWLAPLVKFYIWMRRQPFVNRTTRPPVRCDHA
jgi:hypothetical protein